MAKAAALSRARTGHGQQAKAQAGAGSFAFALRLNLFALFLTAFWTPLNTLLLPGLVEPLAPAALRGSALGTLTLLGVGIAVLAQPIFGALSDRWQTSERRRVPMTAAALIAGPLLAAMWFAPNFGILLLVYVALQCGMNFAQAAFQALIPDVVPADQRARPSATKSALDVGGNAVGLGVAGGLILVGAGEAAVMWALVVLCAAGAAIAWFTAPRVEPRTRLKPLCGLPGVFSPLRDGPPEFRAAVAMRFLFLLGLYPVQRFILFVLEDRFEVDEPLARASMFILVCIFVAALAGLTVGAFHNAIGGGRIAKVATLVACGALIGIAFAPTLPILAIAGVVLAAAAGAFQAVNWGVLAKSLRDDQAARYFGLANIATAGASALAGAFGPLVDIAQQFIPGATYQILFCICAAIAASALWPGRKVSSEASAAR